MRVKVIEPPDVVVTPDDARLTRVFKADDEDEYVEMLLSIAQSEIDGPQGWLGRAIGEQDLEATFPACFQPTEERLPYPPLIEVLSNELSGDGCTRKIIWRAGYEEVPPALKHAIIMMAGELRDAVPNDGGDIKRKTVDGVGSWEYSLPGGAADAMKSAAERLLAPFRVYR
jgi:hypothetical protein